MHCSAQENWIKNIRGLVFFFFNAQESVGVMAYQFLAPFMTFLSILEYLLECLVSLLIKMELTLKLGTSSNESINLQLNGPLASVWAFSLNSLCSPWVWFLLGSRSSNSVPPSNVWTFLETQKQPQVGKTQCSTLKVTAVNFDRKGGNDPRVA